MSGSVSGSGKGVSLIDDDDDYGANNNQHSPPSTQVRTSAKLASCAAGGASTQTSLKASHSRREMKVTSR